MTEWRIIASAPLYAVSEDGQVKRVVASRNHPADRVLLLARGEKGYFNISLTLPDGRRRNFQVQRLVCEAWHGPPPSPAHQAAHIDGDQTNNHFTNLAWKTPKANTADKVRHGTSQIGDRNHRTRLTPEIVREIRRTYTGRRGEMAELGRRFGIVKSGIRAIIRREVWKGVE